MNTDIMQMSIITIYGNAILQGKDVSFDKNHPGAHGYRKLKFLEDLPEDYNRSMTYLADNPNDWFKYLKDNNYTRLYLNYQTRLRRKSTKQRNEILEGGGTPWSIIAIKGSTCDIWKLKQETVSGEGLVIYYKFAKDIEIPKIPKTTVKQAKLYLGEVFKDLINFCKENKLTSWENVFSKAKAYLSNENSSELLVEGFLPENCFSIEAEQILIATDNAWVFGGMGSWNDVVRVSDYDLYRRLTNNLYDTNCESIVAATNSYPK
ncbi:MAG: hypothetical protein ACTSSH_04805 [Candidatus Heimdallarchaeota archaeon]